MLLAPRDQALEILTTRHMKNLLEHILHRYRVRLPITAEMTDEEVFDTGYVVLANVLVDAWSAKLRNTNVLQLLNVAPIVAKIKEWRHSTGDNVFHTVCSKFDIPTIRMIIEKLGKELFREPNDYGIYPIFSILSNTHPNVQERDVKKFLESLTSNEPDLAQLVLLKDELLRAISANNQPLPRYRQFKKEAIDVIAKHDLFTDEDRKKVLALFRPPAPGQPGINKLIMHAVTVMKFSTEDLEHIYNVLFENPLPLHYIMNGTPEFLHFLLSNKPQEIRTFASAFATFMQDVFAKMPKEAYAPLFFKALQLYEPSIFQPLPETIEKRNAKAMHMVMLMLQHIHDIPKQYLYFLNPFKDSWIRNRLKNSGEEPIMKFPIDDLPVEMIVYLIAFLSHQSALALSLANKQFYEYVNNPTVWSNLYSKYLPLKRVPENQFDTGNNPCRVFYKHYNTKFSTHHRIERLPVIAPAPGGFTSLELKEDTLVYCSTHHIGVIDFSKHAPVVTAVNKPSSARILNDIVFVYTSNAIKMLARDSLSTLRSFATPVPATIKDAFAVNEHALVTPRCVYDWRTGHLMSTWEERIEHVILRDNVYYGLSTTGLVIKDIRQSDNMTRVDTDVPSLGQVSLNAYGNYLYIAGNQIETYDLRYLRRMTVSPFTTKIDEPKVIDLVSMTVWTPTLIWDLIDNKWEHLLDSDMAKAFTSQLAVCNGKEIICPGDRSLYRIHLPNDTCFPYGDFKSQYLASPYNGVHITWISK